jgi:hypothetical protein
VMRVTDLPEDEDGLVGWAIEFEDEDSALLADVDRVRGPVSREEFLGRALLGVSRAAAAGSSWAVVGDDVVMDMPVAES